MKKKITKIMIAIMFLAGLSLLLYPLVSNEWNSYRQERLISNYDSNVSKMEAEGKIDYDNEWNAANAYNEALLPSILPDSFAVAEAAKEEDKGYMSSLNLNGDGMMGYVEIPKIDVKVPVFHTTEEEVLQKAAGHLEDKGYMSSLNLNGDGMMGYVEIPKIDVKVPVFHTTEEEVLQKAAGHLEGSSLPVGGPSTHSVISAHRGLPSATLFTDLDKLEEGDHFLLRILDDILCYKVDKISVVEPTETDGLAVEEGQDLVTLLTCTPYGVNSQRLLVRGHRVPYEEAEMEEVPKGDGLAVEEGQDLVTLLTCTPYGVNSQRLLVRGHRVPYEEAEMEEVPKGLLTGASLHYLYSLRSKQPETSGERPQSAI